MDKNIVYVPVSVATPPDKDGFYFTLSDGRTGNNWYKDGKWIDEIMNGGKTIVTHWLKPISIDELAGKSATDKILMEVEKIRKQSGVYIWAFPITYREEGNVTKITFGWELEWPSGQTNWYKEECSTYEEALNEGIKAYQ